MPALFPTTMFPSFSQAMPEQKPEEHKMESREQRDEIVEAIAALAVLRILTQGT